MALSRNRRSERHVDYWPGFVDALSTLLLAIMFLLSVFVLMQFLLSQEVNNKDSVLNRLNSQISELTELLSLERGKGQDLEDTLAGLQASLTAAENEKSRLQSLLASGGSGAAAEQRAGELSATLDAEKQVSARALSQVELLNQQIAALRRQIGALEDALNASEARDRESNTKIADLGKRLNVALAQRVQELNRYRSDFFGRLREILSDRENIRIVGDRFVFQSEVLFPTGSADINPQGLIEMKKLADAVVELNKEIPDDINWVLRVDGHTDNVPLSGTGRYRDNWELSSARATAVVKFLIANGVPANRLVAAGFGEYQPLEADDSSDARSRNRRIELKLTER
ncbi:peptidoglycan -binding protein [Pseudochrobactrum algeriensis]|uniref:Chemotaxis protein MotB n=1 Tax=Pseudochrobactrum saccharolyticum TaxID=354352 RepID=A0A7W8EPC7_9HYPH|nr:MULTISPECIES: peptidoglycan -binding protein [Pseudochrobactrum]MBX8813980.1 peptidoglycan -binding protein [Ochrobactrum sp. MR34]KAB0536919.1 peptidoglycan -binding protein [Pseudochrobactrum saccharolyticum]MBB5092460.1 chemotaxis protein MotB [Pseudochrobactrum saccharolyticum]MDP8251072.1 peptidoglycan -binding protein [Pseudochrobactrum saccharolyticum]QVQ36417.1 peptidoglycan -binding protein [Pseudochrobactrum algeriensis]